MRLTSKRVATTVSPAIDDTSPIDVELFSTMRRVMLREFGVQGLDGPHQVETHASTIRIMISEEWTTDQADQRAHRLFFEVASCRHSRRSQPNPPSGRKQKQKAPSSRREAWLGASWFLHQLGIEDCGIDLTGFQCLQDLANRRDGAHNSCSSGNDLHATSCRQQRPLLYNHQPLAPKNA